MPNFTPLQALALFNNSEHNAYINEVLGRN